MAKEESFPHDIYINIHDNTDGHFSIDFYKREDSQHKKIQHVLKESIAEIGRNSEEEKRRKNSISLDSSIRELVKFVDKYYKANID